MKIHKFIPLFISLFYLYFTTLSLNAQNNTSVTISTERGSRGEVNFTVNNSDYVPYTVTLTFKNLTGARSYNNGSTIKRVVYHGRNRFLTLNPENDKVAINYSYNYKWEKGDISAKMDTTFVYLLPIKSGKTTLVSEMISLDKSLHGVDDKKMTGYSFTTVKGDTIYAARSGVVTKVVDDIAATEENRTYSRNENLIEVYHADGSFAQYKLFLERGIFVKEGDHIRAGQPLGIIDGSNYNSGSHLRLVFYNPIQDISSMPVNFYLGNGTTGRIKSKELYWVEHPQEIITKEMNKKYMEQ